MNDADPDAEEGRRLLQAVDAQALITDDLHSQVKAVLDDISCTTTEARDLRQRVEDLHARVQRLDDEHNRLLKTRFPDGVPELEVVDGPDVVRPFDQMTGNDRVFPAFHQLLEVLHNAVSDYPHETRHDAEEVRETYRQMYSR